MSKPTQDVSRSGRSILSFQLQSVCSAMRVALQTGQSLGSPTISILQKLRADFLGIVKHPGLIEFPEIDENWKSADLLVIAELMYGTLDAFLSPEEKEEKRKLLGFDRVDLGVGPLRLGLG